MCTNMPFKIYTGNKYMWALSLAIVSISISITIGDGTETRSKVNGTNTQQKAFKIYDHYWNMNVLFSGGDNW